MLTESQRLRVPLSLSLGTIAVLAFGGTLFVHARGKTNTVALSSSPKGVTAVEARAATYRPSRRYVGTIEPWVSARVGPQLVSAYVDNVLVRPGSVVKRGQILATLDCRTTAATGNALSMQARALETTQAALARESSRVQDLLKGGYASTDEAEQKLAESQSKKAQLLAIQAQLSGHQIQVGDCVLRAPFDGEVADRLADPGTFVRPGMPVVTVVDRRVLRVAADVPENDFEAVAPGTNIDVHVVAVKRDVSVAISRRSPSADMGTRTIHFEADLQDPSRLIPVGTTAEIGLEVGEPMQVTEIPLIAAAVKGSKAAVFVVSNGSAQAKSVGVKGERNGQLFVDTALAPGSWVVTEGRSALADGDRVVAKQDTPPPVPSGAEAPTAKTTVNWTRGQK